MVLVVHNLTFGRLTNMLMHIQLILVFILVIIDVRVINVEMERLDRMECVTKMGVI